MCLHVGLDSICKMCLRVRLEFICSWGLAAEHHSCPWSTEGCTGISHNSFWAHMTQVGLELLK